MKTYTQDELKVVLDKHLKWRRSEDGGERANLSGADLSRANLSRADLSGAYLSRADLSRANLSEADLSEADLSRAYLSRANLSGANLSEADLSEADLSRADLSGANLSGADLSGANLSRADLSGANLSRAVGLIKLMGVCLGNRYYKRVGENFINKNYSYTVGLNVLREGEKFANDERELCSFPGFHFAPESWCNREYGERRYSCLIRIPTKEEYPEIEINEPWATDGKASANAIIIEKIFDMQNDGKDVTEQFIGWADGRGNKLK